MDRPRGPSSIAIWPVNAPAAIGIASQAAHPLLDDILAIGSATRGQALDGVSEEDRDRLFDILSRMKSNLHKPGRQRVRRHGHDQ